MLTLATLKKSLVSHSFPNGATGELRNSTLLWSNFKHTFAHAEIIWLNEYTIRFTLHDVLTSKNYILVSQISRNSKLGNLSIGI